MEIRKFFTKKRLIISIFVLLIILFVVYKYFGNSQSTEYTTVKTGYENIIQTVSATGAVKSESDINLNFKNGGTIKEVLVKEGDKVVVNQPLIKLDDSGLLIQKKQKFASFASARAILNKMIVGVSPEDTAISQEKVNLAEVNYLSAKKNYENIANQLNQELKTYEVNLKKAEDDLAATLISVTDTENTQNKSIDNYLDSLLITMENQIFVAKGSLDIIYQILTNDDALPTLGIKDTSTVPLAWDNYKKTEQEVSLIEEKVFLIKNSADSDAIILTSSEVINFLNNVNNSLDMALAVLLNTVATFDYPDNELSADKVRLRTEQTTTNASINSMVIAKNNFVSATVGYNPSVNTASDKVTSAKNALSLAQKNLDLAKATYSVKLNSAENETNQAKINFDLAKAELNYKIATPREVDIASQKAIVLQMAAMVEEINKDIVDATLLAPVEGIITKIQYKIGERISSANSVVSMIGESDWQIEVDISESDIAKVSLNDPAEITFDAFTDDVKFIGKVFFIDPAETIIQEVVYYRVKVLLDKTAYEIKPGMTADVKITTAQKDNVLTVPQRAIIYENDKKYVRVLENGAVKEIEVVVGLRSDEGTIELLSGLKEGEEVITYIKNGNR